MNKKFLVLAIIVSVIIIIFVIASQKDGNKMGTPVISNTTSSIPQEASDGPIKLTVNRKFEYEPREISAKLGSKVTINGDTTTLVGGMDTVIIEGYGVRKLITSNDNIIEFVADKPGTFKIYCANGMGDGKLIVK